jgi:hypothetical protein
MTGIMVPFLAHLIGGESWHIADLTYVAQADPLIVHRKNPRSSARGPCEPSSGSLCAIRQQAGAIPDVDTTRRTRRTINFGDPQVWNVARDAGDLLARTVLTSSCAAGAVSCVLAGDTGAEATRALSPPACADQPRRDGHEPPFP